MPIECQKAEQNSPSQSRRCAINSWRGGWLFTTPIGRKGWKERKFRLNIRTCWQRDVLSYKVAYKCNRKPIFWIRRTRRNNREWRKCYREQLCNDRKGDIKVIYLQLSHSSLPCFCSNLEFLLLQNFIAQNQNKATLIQVWEISDGHKGQNQGYVMSSKGGIQ